MAAGWILLIFIVGSSIWVLRDASSVGARKGVLGGGFLDRGVASWFLACLFLWIIAFPCYLAARRKLVAARVATSGDGGVSPQAAQQISTPPHYSADGHHWWDGQQWVAVCPPPYKGGSFEASLSASRPRRSTNGLSGHSSAH